MKTRSACGWGKACLKGAAASMIAILVATGAAYAQSAERAERGTQEIRTFDIPAQPLAGAIIMLAEQADLRLIAPQALADGKTAPALKGEYTSAEVLARLLEGSDLVFEITADGRLLLRQKPAKEKALDNPGHASQMLERRRTAQSRQPDSNKSQSQDTEEEEESEELEEIVITGSHIRGTEPVGSKLIVFDREAIDRTGFSTVQDVIQSLPQNFGGGPNAITVALQPGVNRSNDAARSFGASINLRGLGSSATLTLIDSRRVAPGGGGSFVDISAIPLSAVERIELLTDGASAIYGTDGIAGVTNIILRHDYEGAETRLRFGSVTDGKQREYTASQLFGVNWKSGNALISYEYQNIDPLFSEERNFAASSDLRPFGGGDFRTQFSNPGNIRAGGQIFAIPRNQDGTELTPDDLLDGTVNLQNDRRGTTLFPSQKRHSVFASVRQNLTDRLALSAEVFYSNRRFESRGRAQELTLTVPDTNPFFVDPFGGLSTIQVQYNFLDDLGPSTSTGRAESLAAVAGASFDISSQWRAEVYGTVSKSSEDVTRAGFANRPALAQALADTNPATAFNPFGDGSHTASSTLAAIKGFSKVDGDLKLRSIDFKVDGPLFRLPAGEVKLALGTHYRKERATTNTVDFEFTAQPQASLLSEDERRIIAAFGELLLPIVAEEQRVPGFKRLDISVAGRIEDYDDFGTTGNPRVGVAWTPVTGLDLRGTYGTSFRAPLLRELDTRFNRNIFFRLPDPKSPTGTSNTILRTGNDPDLGPEKATTWTIGADLRPAAFADFSLSATYFRTEFKGRIDRAGDIFGILPNEDIFAPLITRNPDLATATALLNDPRLLNLVGSTDPNDVDAIVSILVTNLGVTLVRGLDVTADYGIETSIGRFDLQLSASILIDFKEAVTATAPLVEMVDTLDRPVDWRMRNRLTWSKGGLSVTAFINYVDNYTNDNVAPSEPISDRLTADLTLSYGTKDQPSNQRLKGLIFTVSVLNITDKAPPFVNNPRGFGFDPEQANPQGRFIAFEIRKQW